MPDNKRVVNIDLTKHRCVVSVEIMMDSTEKDALAFCDTLLRGSKATLDLASISMKGFNFMVTDLGLVPVDSDKEKNG